MSASDGADESAKCAASSLAQVFHDEGFVSLSGHAHLTPSAALVERMRDVVLRKYEAHLHAAKEKQIDLALLKNAEVLAGFYVRQGGRVDMQISAVAFQKPVAVVAGDDSADSGTVDDLVIDSAPLQEMATCWRSLVEEIFRDDTVAAARDDGNSDSKMNGGARVRANYRLEYIGCVVSRPGDADQNWHLDGVHRNLNQHEKADRLNVFVPLVDLSEQIGGTEMKKKSHFRINDPTLTTTDGSASSAASFEHYAHLESVTHLVKAGTPLVMDYRVWHRGRANAPASETLRPLLYFKYVKLQSQSQPTTAKRTATETIDKNAKKTKKRVVLTQVAN